MIRCRFCHEEIFELRYSEEATEYGSCNLHGEDWERSGVDESGNITFSCPECGRVEDTAEDIWEEIDDEDEEESPRPQESSITEERRGENRTRMGEYLTSQTAISPCPTCNRPVAREVPCVCREDQ